MSSGEKAPRTADHAFGAAIAQLYDSDLVPLLFEPYAAITATRVAQLQPRRVLELAAGTGVVTRAMAAHLPADVEITAIDLNQTMLDRAKSVGTARPVNWQQADALTLPFDNASFDAVVCQFGAMFFPDRPRAYAEARRVLTPGGTFVLALWDRIEDNEFAAVVTDAMATQWPNDPPEFLRRTPHGYFDAATILRDLKAGGFEKAADLETIAERSRARSARQVAVAYCEGTPLRNEIEARAGLDFAGATRVAEEALAKRFGTGVIDGKIQAHIVTVAR